MTDEDYRARIIAIEDAANDEFAMARKRFTFWHEPRRSVRYANGIGDCIIESALAPQRAQIEADMAAQTQAVEREYYKELEAI